MARLVNTDIDVSVFAVEEDNGMVNVDSASLHNTRLLVGGYAVVLVVGEPDDLTYQLLGLRRQKKGGETNGS